MYHAESILVPTSGRGFYPITEQIQRAVAGARVANGLCTVFLHHTSASLILCENASVDVQRDLEAFFSRLVKDGDPLFRHDDEGPDDMPAHIRTILTLSSLTVPVAQHACDLGTWQGIYVWEHRIRPHRRRLTISVMGE